MNIDEEISEFIQDPLERLDQESIEQEQAQPRGRGAPKIPEMWTRVISFSSDNLDNLKIYPIAPDLLLESGYEKQRRRKGEPQWECHFSPKQYLQLHPNPELDRMRLSDERL